MSRDEPSTKNEWIREALRLRAENEALKKALEAEIDRLRGLLRKCEPLVCSNGVGNCEDPFHAEIHAALSPAPESQVGGAAKEVGVVTAQAQNALSPPSGTTSTSRACHMCGGHGASVWNDGTWRECKTCRGTGRSGGGSE